jgi:hypothetical protein
VNRIAKPVNLVDVISQTAADFKLRTPAGRAAVANIIRV